MNPASGVLRRIMRELAGWPARRPPAPARDDMVVDLDARRLLSARARHPAGKARRA